jgi:hypothetical protein
LVLPLLVNHGDTLLHHFVKILSSTVGAILAKLTLDRTSTHAFSRTRKRAAYHYIKKEEKMG